MQSGVLSSESFSALPGATTFPATRPQGRLLINAATYNFRTPERRFSPLGAATAGARSAMDSNTNTDPQSDVLHSETHSKLSSEEIAKAVARHNKNHPAGKAKDAAAQAPNTPAKAQKRPKP
jgi:hypothetical protein